MPETLAAGEVFTPDSGRAADEPAGPDSGSIPVSASVPETGPGTLSSLSEIKETEADTSAVADPAKPARKRKRPRSWWPAASVSIGFAAVLFGSAAFYLGLHKNRGNSGATLPVHNITVRVDGAQKTILPSTRNRSADAPYRGPRVPTGPIGKITVEKPKTGRPSVAEFKSGNGQALAPSSDPRLEADHRNAKDLVPAKPAQETASIEKAAIEPLKLDRTKINKSMRWNKQVYILDAEDEVHEGAKKVNETYKKYVRANRALAFVESLKRQKEELRGELNLVGERMQTLDAMSIAKRRERQLYEGAADTSIIAAAIKQIDDDIASIDNAITQCRTRVEQIPREQLALDEQLGQLNREMIAPAEVQKLQSSIRQNRDDYLLVLKDLRERVNLIKRLYDEVAIDPNVKNTLASIRKASPRLKYELGPSPKFEDVERKLKQHEAWVKPPTSSRAGRGGSKATATTSRGLPPEF